MNIGQRAVGIASINAAGALIGLVFHVLLARVLGVGEYGQYIFVIAVATLLGTLAISGFDTAALRFVAEYREKGDFDTLGAFTRFAQQRVLFTSAAIGAAWLLLALGPLAGGDLSFELELCGAGLVMCIAYAQVHASLLQGEGRAAESQAIQLIARPLALIGAMGILALQQDSNKTVHMLLITAGATVLTGAWMQWRRNPGARATSPVASRSPLRSVWSSAAVSMLWLAIVNQVLVTGDIVIATLVLGPEDAGVYAAAVRLASVVSFATTSFNLILAPTIAALFTRRDMRGLQQTVSRLTVGAILFAAPVLLGIGLFGRELLSLFGQDFVKGYWVLLILCVGQAVLTANGAVGFLMTMTSNHVIALRVTAASAGLLLLLSLVLAPQIGLIGIAIAAAVATACRSIVLDYFVRTRIGIKAASLSMTPMVVAGFLGSLKEFAKLRMPGPYAFAHGIYYPVLREVRLVSKVGFRGLIRHSMTRPGLLESLPLQKIRLVALSTSSLTTLTELLAYLAETRREYAVGGHSIYVPPSSLHGTVFSEAVAGLPANCGLKILKNIYTQDGVAYLHGPQSRLQRAITYAPHQMVLVAAMLHSHGLGPRVLDFLRIRSGDSEWFAYAVEHCEGAVPSSSQCQAAMGRLRGLESEGLLTVTVPGGYGHPDLTCPGCNGNAVTRSSDNRFQYLDFQNFVLENYDRHLARLAQSAVDETHFGDKSIFRGGEYLYQSVPGVNLSAKRATDARSAQLAAMLEVARVSIEDVLVLDVGCNLGMMMGEYLSRGAVWCHGWDHPYVIPHTQELLLAMGCTRFSTTGVELHKSRNLAADIPDHLHGKLTGCWISYLSVKGHVGWMDSLFSIPWGTLIVEGHESESSTSFDLELQTVSAQANARIAARTSIKDGDSGSRQIAVLVRQIQ